MRVKICGITNISDALLAAEGGADGIGFVFYPNSPRYIPPEKAREIVEKLPPFVTPVALFVKTPPEEVNRIVREVGAHLAQLHWETGPDYWDRLEVPFLPVVRVRRKEDLEIYRDRYRLVDPFVPTYGGSGKRIPVEWFEGVESSKLIIAGGLTPENLPEVLKLNPYGVDVSSGVERAPGRKDPKKVVEFLKIAKGG